MISATIQGIDLVFHTSEDVFSPRHVDKGTLAMLSVVHFADGDKVCDLGCGYGAVGILAAKFIGAEKVTMMDNNESAVRLARENAALNGVGNIHVQLSDGFTHVPEKDFTLIICHPPYHTDFAVPKMFIEKGFTRLAIGGKMYMVTKRKDWYKNKFISIFGGVKIWEIDGYFVFMAEKKSQTRELDVREHPARCAGQRDHLQHLGNGERKQPASRQLSDVSV